MLASELFEHKICPVCGCTPCNCTHVTNESTCAKHISPSGAETTMCPDDDDYEINYGKTSSIADFRKKQGLDVKTGKKVNESSHNIEVGDKITWWYNKYHPDYQGIVRKVAGNTIIVYAPGSGDRFKLTKDDIRSHEKNKKKGVAEDSDPCWKGYKQIGMKDKAGKKVPNCVPEGTDIVPAANPEDTVSLDIPLLIRLLEYAREDAKTDMDLHDVAERLITMSADGKTLSMNDYGTIIPNQP